MFTGKETGVDVNDFLKNVTPASPRSRLTPFWSDIVKLRKNDCSLNQVRTFLKANGVEISIAGLSKYIKKREEKENFDNNETRSKAGQNQQGGAPAASPVLPVNSPAPPDLMGGNDVVTEEGIVDVFAKQAEREAKKAAEAKRPKLPRR